MTTPPKKLLAALALSGSLLASCTPALSQHRSQAWGGIRAFLDVPGQGQTIKCGFPIVSAARSLEDSMGIDAGTSITRILQRPSMQKSILVGAFRIHYDTVGQNTPALLDNQGNRIDSTYDAYADSVATIANHVRGFEIDSLGYDPPPPDNGLGGGDEYDVYIVKWVLEPSLVDAYGLTEPENQISGSIRWTSFLKIHNDFSFVRPSRGRDNRGLPGLKVTLAHEYHHAIQLGAYGLWSGHEYFYEITSTWLEDVLYTDVNDYDQYLPAHFNHPEEAFTTFDPGGVIQYGRCLWGHFVAKRFGRGSMRRAWESIRTMPPLPAMDNALQTYYQSNFREAFAEWTKWNYFTGARDSSAFYPEGGYYPQVAQTNVYLTPPSQGGSASAGALGSTYLRVIGRPDTLTVILASTDFDAAISGNTGPFDYFYYLSNDVRDETSRLTPIGVYFSYNADPSKWFIWFVVGKNASSAPARIGAPFPNPLVVGKPATMRIAVVSTVPVPGTLTIFTSSMDLIYSSQLTSSAFLSGQQAFAWNGLTNRGNVVQSGIYYFVLEFEGQRYTGKFAVVRR